MTTTTSRPPRRVFYGWYVVAAVFVITTTTSGLAFYNLSILLAAFVAEQGFPVGLASSATATFFVAGGIGGMIAGRLVDRIDARIVIAAGASIGALTLASAGLLRELWQLYAFHVVFGLCHGAAGLVPVTTVVARWFSVRRALAFSIASTGLSFGGILVAPFVALAIERVGLAGRRAVARPRPLPRHRAGDADRAAPEPGRAGPGARRRRCRPTAGPARRNPPSPSPRRCRSRYFYAVSIAYLFLLGAQVGAIAHFYRLASTRVGRGDGGARALGARGLEHDRSPRRRLDHAQGVGAALCAGLDADAGGGARRCWPWPRIAPRSSSAPSCSASPWATR